MSAISEAVPPSGRATGRCQRPRFRSPRWNALSRRALAICLLVALLAAALLQRTLRFSELSATTAKSLTDFDAFHIVGTMVWNGAVGDAYRAQTMERALAAYGQGFLPWTYPPPFNLVVAPLGLMPIGTAYAVFVATTLAAYLLVLRRIAGTHLAAVLATVFPALFVTIANGQNGFLTGALIGLACLGLLAGRGAAGLPLGLMVVKPHLAVGLALYAVATRRWRTVALAAIVVAVASGLATLAFGLSVWSAFAAGASEARDMLEHGAYQEYRMISAYAFARSIGLPAGAATALQIVVACAALATILAAIRLRMTARQALGIAVLAGLLASPYAYDYDLAALGIGLALLLPDLLRLGSRRESIVLLGLSGLACAWGLLQTAAVLLRHGGKKVLGADEPLSLAAPLLILVLILSWRILRRDRPPATGTKATPSHPAAACEGAGRH